MAAVARMLLLASVVAAAAAVCPYSSGCRCVGNHDLVKCDGSTVKLNALPQLNPQAGNWSRISMARNNISAVPDAALPHGLTLIESWFTPLADWGPRALDASRDSFVKIIVQHHNMTKVPECLGRLGGQFTYLDLTWGGISDVTALANGTEGLKWIKLDGNAISDVAAVEAAMRPHLRTLGYIGLGFNKLTAAPNVSAYVNTGYFHSIGLDNNFITDIPAGMLGDKLYSLEARNNLLTEVPKDLIRQNNLWTLRLSGNRIKSIDSFEFGSKLTNLDLDNNLIEELHVMKFPGGTRCRWVQLFNNPLKYIAPDAFAHAKEIRQLTLSNTALTKLPLAVTALPRLAMLYLNGVNLTCTCDEKAVGAWKVRHASMNVGGYCQGNVTVTRFLHELMPQCP